jgi:hypothetical protein
LAALAANAVLLIGEVPEWPIGAVSKTVVGLAPTVGSNPTLSAGYKIPPRQLRLHLLPDLIILVVQLSKCKGSATEIAQFQLGDLTFKVHTPHYIYSSALVKVLWDICNWISTMLRMCPVSGTMSRLSYPLLSIYC